MQIKSQYYKHKDNYVEHD